MFNSHRLAATFAVGAVGASLVSIAVAANALVPPRPRHDPCAISMDAASLSSRDRSFIARRALACSDVTHGRISGDAYRDQIAAIDRAWTEVPPVAVATEILTPQWGSVVRGFSSQYGTSSWAADRVLGAPDVFPAHGDLQNAWASRGADDQDEWIEVGYAQPMRVSAVEVYETFNPGAVSAIELVTASGQRVVAFSQDVPQAAGQVANKLRTEMACTAEPIVAVHVRVSSTRVQGWNEIDAVGLVPCAAQ